MRSKQQFRYLLVTPLLVVSLMASTSFRAAAASPSPLPFSTQDITLAETLPDEVKGESLPDDTESALHDADVLPPPDPKQQAELFDSLIERANREGKVRVIVWLNVEWVPVPRLSAVESQDQVSRVTAAADRLLSLLSTSDVANVKRFDEFIPFLAITIDAKALGILRYSSEIRGIEEDRVLRLDEPRLAVSNDGEGLDYPNLRTSVHTVGASTMWLRGYTGDGWTVAVLDTGIDTAHPFLIGKVGYQFCRSREDNVHTYRPAILCPNGQTSMDGTFSGRDCSRPGLESACGHGTHVAGIATGRYGGPGVTGVAPKASLMSAQVFHRTSYTEVVSHSDDILDALNVVFGQRSAYKIAAVNLSLGVGDYAQACDSASPSVFLSVQNLVAAGIAVIAGSGNDGKKRGLAWPACMSNVVSVGATDNPELGQGNVWDGSNSSASLDLLAPGNAIYSSYPGGVYTTLLGTSMAAPHVSGAFALLRQRAPSASVGQILDALTSTGVLSLPHFSGEVVKTVRRPPRTLPGF